MDNLFDPTIPLVILVIVISLLCIFGLIVWLAKGLRRPEMYGMSRNDVAERWQQVEDLVNRGDELSLKMAVMEADKLLDHALKARMFAGETLGERLKVAVYKYPKLRDVWPAHLMRNRLVHEANFRLNNGEAKRAISNFRKSLQELGVL